MIAPGRWLVSFDLESPASSLVAEGLAVRTLESLTIASHGVIDQPEHSPTEDTAAQVLANFARRGSEALKDLRGVFAIAVADRSAHSVVVARDPLGIHPLFWTRVGNRLLFAGGSRDLIQQPGVSRALNRPALADHLCHRWPRGDETFYEQIHRIPPGSRLLARDGVVAISRYWDPAPQDEPVRWATDEEVESFASTFARSVDRCMRAAPVAIFLSGGLDSISVATAAADRARARGEPPPLALSLAMADPECDERPRQVAVARSLGLPQHIIPFDDAVGTRGLIRRGLELGATLSSPLLNIWGPAYESLASIGIADGVRTILTGSGGDEWLSVSPYLSADLISAGDIAGWWTFFGTLRSSYQRSFLMHTRLTAWTYGLRPLASRGMNRVAPSMWRRRRQRRMARHDPRWVAPDPALRVQQRARAADALEPADPAQGFYLREVRSGVDHPLTSWELDEQYEFGQRLGVQYRHPFWDADLVDVLYRTPPDRLSRGGRTKALVRNALAERFPELGLDQQRKVSATRYLRDLLDSQLPAAAADIKECAALAELGVISRDAATNFGRLEFGPATTRWDVMSLETWVRANR